MSTNQSLGESNKSCSDFFRPPIVKANQIGPFRCERPVKLQCASLFTNVLLGTTYRDSSSLFGSSLVEYLEPIAPGSEVDLHQYVSDSVRIHCTGTKGSSHSDVMEYMQCLRSAFYSEEKAWIAARPSLLIYTAHLSICITEYIPGYSFPSQAKTFSNQ